MLDVPAFIETKNALYGDAFVLLVEIEYAPGEYLRWARLNDRTDTAITFEGETWTPFPFGKPRRPQNARAEIPTFEIPIANPERVLQSILENYRIEGKTGRLITMHREHIGDPTAKVEEWFTIASANAHASVISLQCRGVKFNPLRCKIPSRTMTRTRYPGLLGNNRHRFY